MSFFYTWFNSLISSADFENKDMMAMPEEEVDMEGMKPADEASEDAPDAGEIEGDVQTEITHFLKSKHKRCIMSPNIARDQLRKVSCDNLCWLLK